MRLYEFKDEQERTMYYFPTTELPNGVVSVSHGYSYLFARTEMQDMGVVMGLEQLCEGLK